MVDKIAAFLGNEILDSRGYPTLRVEVRLDSGITATASVPSGASTGEGEARELRDRDPARYEGGGVLKAIANLEEIGRIVRGRDPTRQSEIDKLLIEADDTEVNTTEIPPPDNWIPMVPVQTPAGAPYLRRGIMESGSPGVNLQARAVILEPQHPFFVVDRAVPDPAFKSSATSASHVAPTAATFFGSPGNQGLGSAPDGRACASM